MSGRMLIGDILNPTAAAGPSSAANANTNNNNNGLPPTLPPSVEEAYRRKCIALKRRLNEVEAINDGYRERRCRMGRSILKLRLERAYLLKLLAKITADPADDTEGSESPTVCARLVHPLHVLLAFDTVALCLSGTCDTD